MIQDNNNINNNGVWGNFLNNIPVMADVPLFGVDLENNIQVNQGQHHEGFRLLNMYNNISKLGLKKKPSNYKLDIANDIVATLQNKSDDDVFRILRNIILFKYSKKIQNHVGYYNNAELGQLLSRACEKLEEVDKKKLLILVKENSLFFKPYLPKTFCKLICNYIKLHRSPVLYGKLIQDPTEIAPINFEVHQDWRMFLLGSIDKAIITSVPLTNPLDLFTAMYNSKKDDIGNKINEIRQNLENKGEVIQFGMNELQFIATDINGAQYNKLSIIDTIAYEMVDTTQPIIGIPRTNGVIDLFNLDSIKDTPWQNFYTKEFYGIGDIVCGSKLLEILNKVEM